MNKPIRYPELRLEVIEALRSLSDPRHQRAWWGRVEEGVNYFDDLTLNVHVLYDDAQVLPDPTTAVPDLLNEAEVPAMRAVGEALGPMIEELGSAPDAVYTADPRWSAVLQCADAALTAMQSSEE